MTPTPDTHDDADSTATADDHPDRPAIGADEAVTTGATERGTRPYAYHTGWCHFAKRIAPGLWRVRDRARLAADDGWHECAACSDDARAHGHSTDPWAGHKALVDADPDIVGGDQR